jgi:hypothetical protein
VRGPEVGLVALWDGGVPVPPAPVQDAEGDHGEDEEDAADDADAEADFEAGV